MKRRALASLLPDRMLRWLSNHAPIDYDPTDGWDFWIDASYIKYVRKDSRPDRIRFAIVNTLDVLTHYAPGRLGLWLARGPYARAVHWSEDKAKERHYA